MESVMNFLAENYIWFFVAAGVLLFALIGFLIDGKNKSKNEFKGESVNTEEAKEIKEVVVETPKEEILDFGGETAPEIPTLENIEVATNNETVSEEAPKEETTSEDIETFEIPTLEETPVNPELESLEPVNGDNNNNNN